MPDLAIVGLNMYAEVDVFSFLFLDLYYHGSRKVMRHFLLAWVRNVLATKTFDSQKFLSLKTEKRRWLKILLLRKYSGNLFLAYARGIDPMAECLLIKTC